MSIDASKLRAAIESVEDLPTLPSVLAKIIEQLGNPNVSAADIGKLISQDQSLSGKVLRLVNSAYYGFPRQIKSVQHAVVILGFTKIRTVIITASVFDAFRGTTPGGLNITNFWRHSLGTALAAKATAETYGAAHLAEDAFVGGLLHDIGKIILDQFQPAISGPIIRYAAEKGLLMTDVEAKVMGNFNHAAIGSWLIEKWHLPNDMVRMVAGHHSPHRYSENRELIAFVHIGDILARALGVGNGGDNRMPSFNPAVAAAFQISEEFLENAIEKFIAEINRAEDFFALATS
ncbi:MAG: HDOD domain-containing protein [Planctomycetota bacterium]|jgi:putative nucleotidyltransferase with HDIG domain|nr:HDOD domain-containing protein [Planctomycetota bacterium]